jgi:hypothetical protein
MKAYGGVYVFLTSALAGGEWSASRLGRFIRVGPRTGLDDVEMRKFLTPPGHELLPLCRPARK